MNKRNIYIDNIPLNEALEKWQKALESSDWSIPLSAEKIPVDDSLGRITAEPVYAKTSSPFYNAAAMDGIAVCFRDTIGASESNPIRLSPKKQFVYVNTGNELPGDFDAVIMIEDIQPLPDGGVEIISSTSPWKHVRTIGEDIVATELILPEGHRIRAVDQGAMLATELSVVKVRRIPKILVLPTGSDLIQPGDPLTPGNIIEFNSRILAGYLQDWGALAERGSIVPDKYDQLRLSIEKAVDEFDIVVINAGASAGSKDFTANVLRDIGQIVIHGVNIKPGKPVILAVVKGKPVIGLPGYPVSAIVTMRLFVRNLIGLCLGIELEPFHFLQAIMSRPVASSMGAEEFVRVKLGYVGNNLMAAPAGRGAGAVLSFAQADGIVTIPAGNEGVGAGEQVRIELLRNEDEIKNTLVFIGSHDNTLDVLANQLHQHRPVYRLSSAHVGSMGGILAVKRGEAHLAGTHLLDEETGEYNVSYIQRFLNDISLRLYNLAYRQQGLLVPKGNPKGIFDFRDLLKNDVTFINRQRGAGTRLLTDMKLRELNISPEQINGYEREEYTHMNVASAVVSGSADTGLAILAAAVALDLDFIPVAEERYDLILPMAHVEDQKVLALLDIMQSSLTFQSAVEKLGGYDLRDCGKVVYEQ